MKLPRIFYGWWIVGAGLILAMLQGVFYIYGFGVLYVPLLKALGSSRAALGSVVGLSRLEGGLIAPIAGWLIDRYGTRPFLFLGLFIMGLGFLVFSRITALWMLYVVFFVLTAGSSFGMRPVSVALANWFIRKRSRAMGIQNVGMGLGGTLGVALAWLVATYGWRTAAVIGGLSFWVIGFPLAWVIRHRPEQMGLFPDGVSPTEGGSQGPMVEKRGRKQEPLLEVEIGPREALATQGFWMLAIAFAVWSAVVAVTTIYQIPFMVEEMGASLITAASVVSVFSLLTIPGRIVFGWLGDILNIRFLMAGAYFLQALGLVALSLVPSMGWVPLYLAILPLAYGGSIPLRMAIVGHFYGRRNYGTITGMLQTVDLPGAVLGPIFVGWVFDQFGSYRPGFQTIALLMVVGGIALLLARRPRVKEHAKVAGGGLSPA